MIQPKFSVIIPSYNRASCLGDAVRSVQAQTFSDWEIIIIDDASSDGTLQTAQGLATADDRIRVLALEKNRGAAGARNAGIAAARGALIAFLDSDDSWLPELLARAAQEFEDNEIGLVCSWGRGDDYREYQYDNINDEENYLSSCPCLMTGTSIRKNVIEQVGTFDERMTCSEDWDFWIRVLQAARGKVIPDFLFEFHQSANSLTLNVSGEDIVAAGDRSIEKNRELYNEHPAALALRYRHEGSFCARVGAMQCARQRFLAAIRTQPFMPGAYLCLFASLFGRGGYETMIGFWNRISLIT